MTRLLALVLFATLSLGLVATVARFALFDRLLRLMFSNLRPQWEALGCPPGFFWSPPGAKVLSGGLTRGELLREWADHAPAWITATEVASTAYGKFRLFSIWSRILLMFFLVEFAMLLLSIFTEVFAR